jgi:hypothetical protein
MAAGKACGSLSSEYEDGHPSLITYGDSLPVIDGDVIDPDVQQSAAIVSPHWAKLFPAGLHAVTVARRRPSASVPTWSGYRARTSPRAGPSSTTSTYDWMASRL